MIRTVVLLGLLAGLAACGDGQPLFDDTGSGGGSDGGNGGGGGGGGGGHGGVVVPADVAGALAGARFTPPSPGNPDGQLIVRIKSLDSTPGQVSYTRNAALDVPGFKAYSVQEDPLDRYFVGLARESNDGSIQAAVVQDGGQFNRYFGGVTYQRNTPYTPYVPTQPDHGLVSYAGRYAGLSNLPAPEPNQTLPVPPGTDPQLVPRQPVRVTGNVFLNADFSDNTVNGAIIDRRALELGRNFPNVVLVPADIAEDGTFSGTAENGGQTGIGSYSGAFGGTGATSVAGGIYIQNYLENFDNEEERGVFVLTRCGRPGDAPICDDVNPTRAR